MPKKYVFVVHTNPATGSDLTFNDWYDNEHIPDVLKIPGFISAQRFKYSELEGTKPASHPYLALYTVETDDLKATHAALQAVAGTPAMVLSDSLDLPTVYATFYEALSDHN